MEENDFVEGVRRLLERSGLEKHAKMRVMGRTVVISIRSDPLERERQALRDMRRRISVSNNDINLREDLLRQIDYFLEASSDLVYNRTLMFLITSNNTNMVARAVAKISDDLKEIETKATELRRLIRPLLSYLREYVRRDGN